MASDIKIEVIENVVETTSDINTINVTQNVSNIEIHNADGLNGITPHIDETTGNWFVSNKDTGVHAQGAKGEDGEDGKDGLTPYIGTNGNWWVGETDLGVQAQGEQGVQGETGKSAYAYAVDGGYQGTEEEFTQFMNDGASGYKDLMPLIYAGL